MDVVLTIKYSTSNPQVNDDVVTTISSILPYMVDNVELLFDSADS